MCSTSSRDFEILGINPMKKMEKFKSDFNLRMAVSAFLSYSTVTLACIYVFFGSLMYLSKDFRNTVLFLHVVNVPLFANFSKPELYGINNTENIYLEGQSGKLGAWFIKPKVIPGRGLFLYLHGNGGTRATSHRVELYKKLSEFGFHVLVVDYRGFADSDGYPTEKGTVEDSRVSWEWLKQHADKESAPMYIWGHSLGSGVAIQLAKQLCDEGTPPRGLILEAPFNNGSDAAKNHPLAKPYALLPFFEDHIIQELKHVYRNDFWIRDVTSPILIMHDKSDMIVPFKLGKKLCLAATEFNLNVECIDIDENLNHKFIYQSRRLLEIIRAFETRAKN